ncbi:MAG: hypothetical protein H7308_17595 [Chthonomonadaceae bacterium]|nr:hypothetical protein [Chthonomonadaceae bacterium]
MGTAYTPGLKVSGHTIIEKTRRLPLKGTVLVKEGTIVSPGMVVARTELPGNMLTIKLAERMGIEPKDVPETLKIKMGDSVRQGDLIAESKGLFGKYFKSEFKSPYTGTVEIISQVTGHIGIREAPTPVEKDAYIEGVVTKVIEGEGVVVTCEGALIQGIFGVGGERQGKIAILGIEGITPERLTEAHRGCIVVGGGTVSGASLKRAAEVGAIGIVCGGVIDRELMDYLAEALNQPGYDIGVAITGQEPIAFTLVITEGFGTIQMANRTYKLLESLEGQVASINGATQIRAGVIRPEVIVPRTGANATTGLIEEVEGNTLDIGTPIRVIREPYFGLLGLVSGLPQELVRVESETLVRVLEAKLDDGRTVTVPRANVEIIQTS